MTRLRRAAVAVVLCVVSGVGAPPAVANDTAETPLQAPTHTELAGLIDAYVEPLVSQDQLSGRLLVQSGDQPAVVRSWGHADVELDVPVDADSKFNIASVTKPMTIIALMALVDAELLRLEDPISTWLPDFPSASEITVDMLLNHRAGVPHRVLDEQDQTLPRTAEQMTRLAAAKDLDFPPGSDESYSSGGFSVLARVMELASGASYQDLLERYVFRPAGMTSSRHVDARELLPGRVSSYLIDFSGGPVNAPLKDLSFLVGAGSVWSTAEDLERMVIALRDGAYGKRAAEGLLRESGFRSNGRTSGFRTFVDWHRETGVTVIFTGNLVTGAADLVRDAMPRLAAGEHLPPPSIPKIESVDVSQSELERYEGAYELRPGRNLTVTAVPGGLRIGSWILIPIGPRLFVSPQDYATVEFVFGPDGTANRLVWTTGERATPMPRVEETTSEPKANGN